MHDSKIITHIKHATCIQISELIAGASREEVALVKTYLSDVLSECKTTADIVKLLPKASVSFASLALTVTESICTATEEQAQGLQAKHPEAYSIICQALLLKMVED